LRAWNETSIRLTTKAERLALRKCLLVMDAFRAIWPIMPLQQAYAFLFVAFEEGRSVEEYALVRSRTAEAATGSVLDPPGQTSSPGIR
jgi:hypothetical protein